MNRITFRSLLAVPALLVLLCVPSIASADGITWTLSGVTFDDGGTATGSFVFDVATGLVSSVNIVTTPGTAFGGATYMSMNPGFNPQNSLEVAFVQSPSVLTTALDLQFMGAGLTDLGGTVTLVGNGLGGGEVECGDPTCFAAGAPLRLIMGGEVVSPTVATPEPSTFLLFGMGLVCLVVVAKLKVLLA